MLRSAKNPNLKISWMPQKRTKNGLKIYWISKKLLWLYLNTLKLKNFIHFNTFYKILTNFLLWFFGPFWLISGGRGEMDLTTPRANYFQKRNVQKNFSSKFQLWAKMITAPPGVQTITIKKLLMANSGMVIGMKNM